MAASALFFHEAVPRSSSAVEPVVLSWMAVRIAHLAAFLLLTPSRGGLAASLRRWSPKSPIEIWYGKDLTA